MATVTQAFPRSQGGGFGASPRTMTLATITPSAYTPVAGRSLLLFVKFNTGRTGLTLTDNQSNTWVLEHTISGNVDCHIFRCAALSSTVPETLTWSWTDGGSDAPVVDFVEVEGLDTGARLGLYTTASAFQTNKEVLVTTTSADDFAFGGIVLTASRDMSLASGIGGMTRASTASGTVNNAAFYGVPTGSPGDINVGISLDSGSGGPVAAVVFASASAGATLSAPTSTSITQTTATVGCTSDSTAGILYLAVTTSAIAPTAADIEAGVGFVAAANVTPVLADANTFAVTGLTAGTTYYTYFVQDEGTADYSNVLSTGTFTTSAVNVGFRITGIQAPNGSPIGSVSPVSVAIWNNAAATHGAVANTVNASGAIVTSELELAHAGTLATDVLVDIQYTTGDPAVLNTVRGVTTLIDLDL